MSLADSSLVNFGDSYTAGQPISLVFNLTDRFGNTISDSETARGILNASTLQLSLRRPDIPQDVDVPWKYSSISSQGISVTFSCQQTGILSVSLILGSEQLADPETGKL